MSRAGEWFLRSGIQQPNGGVARYYRTDLERNHAVSTEITGYAASAFVYLHTITKDARYLDRAVAAARFLTRTAWDSASATMPFEIDPPALQLISSIAASWFAAWSRSGASPPMGSSWTWRPRWANPMLRDFASADGSFHPILSLPDKRPLEPDAGRWSRSPGCYQLKAAMAWWDLLEATADEHFREPYERVLEYSLGACGDFLPGHAERPKVMDRLHAFLYFLEGLLPSAQEPRVAAAIRDGIPPRRASPARDCAGVRALRRLRPVAAHAPLCRPGRRPAAGRRRRAIRGGKTGANSRPSGGGFYFGRKAGAWLPYVNPVSSAFALQALELWDECRTGKARVWRHLLI